MIEYKSAFPWDKLTDEQMIDTQQYRNIPNETEVPEPVKEMPVSEEPEKVEEHIAPVEEKTQEPEPGESIEEERTEELSPELSQPVPLEPEIETVEEERMDEEEMPSQTEDTGRKAASMPGAFLHISPSQQEMFSHLSRSERERKKAYIAIAAGVICFLMCFLGLITAGFFLISCILAAIYGVKCMKESQKEATFLTDPKRGYLRMEGGWLHCEQGVGTQYEELHIPVSKIASTLAFGNMSGRQLVIKFRPEDAVMSVNGMRVEEDLYELRGGVYDREAWKMFTKTLDMELPIDAKFDVNAWDEDRKTGKILPIFAILFAVLGIISKILLLTGIINIPLLS